jgi:hypothetical protein
MRDLGHPGSKSAAEVCVVAGDPVFAGRGEDVEVDGVFESEDFVRDVGWDDQDFIGIEDGFDWSVGAGVVQEEFELAGEKAGYLLVVVLVQGNVGAFAEGDAGDHNIAAGDELAA